MIINDVLKILTLLLCIFRWHHNLFNNGKELLGHLWQVFDCLCIANIKLKLTKMWPFQNPNLLPQTLVSLDRISLLPKKLNVIKSMPPPKNIKEVPEVTTETTLITMFTSLIHWPTYVERMHPSFEQNHIKEPLQNLKLLTKTTCTSLPRSQQTILFIHRHWGGVQPFTNTFAYLIV